LGAEENISSCEDEVAGGWRKFHNEELHNEYGPQNIITTSKSRRGAGHVAPMEEMRNANRILILKPERKRPHARHKHRG
jgi:hypothetical protein